MTDKTPPTGTPAMNPPPPRPLPTLATVQASVDAMMREVRGARLDIDALKTETKAVRSKLTETEEIIRVSYLPRVTSLTPAPPTPRPSMAATAAKKGLDFGKYTALVIGVLSIAAQVAASFQPKYLGPISAILKLFGVDQ